MRIHPEFLDKQKLPAGLAGKDVWKERFKSIRNFERHLVRNGTKVLKFHLRVSKEEQRQRFLDRLEQPAKRWKFNMADVAERAHWDDYMDVYEEMIRETSTEEAPWYVVPADNKGFARLIVAAALDDALDDLDLAFPKVANSPELQKVRQALLDEGMPKAAAAKKRVVAKK